MQDNTVVPWLMSSLCFHYIGIVIRLNIVTTLKLGAFSLKTAFTGLLQVFLL